MVEQVEVECSRCQQCCYGEVVCADGKYYHQYCFSCVSIGCSQDLAKDGFFIIDGEIYCRNDYRKLLGVKCTGCSEYIEGNAVTAMGFNFHPSCFGCVSCGKVFPAGSDVCYDGDDFFCKACNKAKSIDKGNGLEDGLEKEHRNQKEIEIVYEEKDKRPICAGCQNFIKEGQSLLALEKQWHLWCFTCFECGCLLTAEYMGREGTPYCERDYQANFGISCAGCNEYITGKVLQAGEKHYHPECSRCAKCGEMFGEGEDMYLQGTDIWHPSCSDAMEDDYESGNDEATVSDLDSPRISPRGCDESTLLYAQPQPNTSTNQPSSEYKSSTIPIPSSKHVEKLISPVPGEEDTPPPVPPLPTRTSSAQWRQRYFTPQSNIKDTPKADNIPSEPSHESEPSDHDEPVGLSSGYSTNSLNSNNSSKAISQKGIGYNRLQCRMNNKAQRTKLPTMVDPDRLRQFLDDPDHNVYLEDHEFVQIFKMSREKFYALPESKKQEVKSGILFT